jgi:acetylglutamate kinase
MQAKLDAACEAVKNGVGEVRIVKGSDADIVARVLTGEAAGTSIVRGGKA